MKNRQPKVSIMSAKRLPIGKINGDLVQQSPETLITQLVKQQFSALPEETLSAIDQVILGNVTNLGGNVARRCALAAGIPEDRPAFTIDAQCASGLVAMVTGAQAIMSGDAQLVLAGGVESTSSANRTLAPGTDRIMTRFPMAPAGQLDLDMGVVAENMSERYQVSRQAQDAYAFRSHQKAKKAFEKQLIQAEIVPFHEENTAITQDQCPRFDTTLDKLAQLKPAFQNAGVVTAGNSCPINDGAATVVLKKYQADEKVQGYYLGQATVGLSPETFLLGPIQATKKLLAQQQLTMADIAVVELNEAFAVQSILCQQALHITDQQLNPLGGALAYGHPYGATGGILVARLLNSLNRIPEPALGIVTLCVAGGMGMSVLVGNQYWTEQSKFTE